MCRRCRKRRRDFRTADGGVELVRHRVQRVGVESPEAARGNDFGCERGARAYPRFQASRWELREIAAKMRELARLALVAV